MLQPTMHGGKLFQLSNVHPTLSYNIAVIKVIFLISTFNLKNKYIYDDSQNICNTTIIIIYYNVCPQKG